MRLRSWVPVLAFVAASAFLACGGRTELLGSAHHVRELSRTQGNTSVCIVYAFDARAPLNDLRVYPRSGDRRWLARTWTMELGGRERTDILAFLDSEQGKYSSDERGRQALEWINRIRDALSRQPLDSVQVSYFFSSDRPGTKEFRSDGWLYLYFLDERSHTIVEINSAFR